MKIRADMKLVQVGKMIAAGDVFLDERIVIHNVKVVQAEKEGKAYSFVAFPEKQRRDKWEPIVVIRDKDVRKAVTDEVNRSVMEQMKLEKVPLDLAADIRLFEKDETRAYATVIYGGLVRIDGIRIYEKGGELKVSFPYEKNGETYQNIAGPTSQAIKKQMTEVIIKAYEDKKPEMEHDLGNGAPDGQTPGGPDPALADVSLPWDRSL